MSDLRGFVFVDKVDRCVRRKSELGDEIEAFADGGLVVMKEEQK